MPKRRLVPILLLAAAALATWAALAGGSGAAQPRAVVLQPNAQAPDLAEQVPSQMKMLTIRAGHRKFYALAFQSVAENLATNYRGQVFVVAHRSSTQVPMMTVDQYINIQDCCGNVVAQQVVPNVGSMIYQHVLVGHDHWHFQDFEVYSLVRASDHRVVSRDHKAGFCLTSDIKVPDPGLPRASDISARAAAASPTITRSDLTPGCGKDHPKLTRVVEALDAGTGDVYENYLGGQNIDVTNLANGKYVLEIRVNPANRLVETNYTNDSASALISIHRTKRGAKPTVRVLKSCPGRTTCP